jgi:hypothetical protein
MKFTKFVYTALSIILLAPALIAQNNVCFSIETNTNSGLAFSGFTKYVNVLDCFEVYAESSIADSKVLHAAAVAAELLDNNEDGVVDDILLKNELAASGALIPIFSFDGSAAEGIFFNNYNGNGAAAVLYNNEMDPSQTGHWGDDATVEEVIHVINAVGHTSIYPSAFEMTANSSLMTAAMDVARGGQFLTIPNPYPSSAWYHYDDNTCDYSCMAIEYMYWSIVSNMGVLNDVSTCNGIANEWEPCSPSLFQSTDVLMYNLITDPQYLLPQLAPDGNYCPQGMSTIDLKKDSFKLYPNPGKGEYFFSSSFKNDMNYSIFDTIGRKIETNSISTNSNVLNLTHLNEGAYVITLSNGMSQQIIITK